MKNKRGIFNKIRRSYIKLFSTKKLFLLFSTIVNEFPSIKIVKDITGNSLDQQLRRRRDFYKVNKQYETYL